MCIAWWRRKTSARYADVLLTREVTEKSITGTVKVFTKKINNFEKRVPPTPQPPSTHTHTHTLCYIMLQISENKDVS